MSGNTFAKIFSLFLDLPDEALPAAPYGDSNERSNWIINLNQRYKKISQLENKTIKYITAYVKKSLKRHKIKATFNLSVDFKPFWISIFLKIKNGEVCVSYKDYKINRVERNNLSDDATEKFLTELETYLENIGNVFHTEKKKRLNKNESII